jgi:hypothetical protein
MGFGAGEGFVGNQYFVLWDAGEVVQFNSDIEAPSLPRMAELIRALIAENGAKEKDSPTP